MWENYRWVLNWTYPENFVNFTMQQTKPEMMYSFSHWCDRPHNDKSILKFDNLTMIPQYILGNQTYA